MYDTLQLFLEVTFTNYTSPNLSSQSFGCLTYVRMLLMLTFIQNAVCTSTENYRVYAVKKFSRMLISVNISPYEIYLIMIYGTWKFRVKL